MWVVFLMLLLIFAVGVWLPYYSERASTPDSFSKSSLIVLETASLMRDIEGSGSPATVAVVL